MDDITRTQSSDGMLIKPTTQIDEEIMPEGPTGTGTQRTDEQAKAHEREGGLRSPRGRNNKSYSHANFKVYKRRWFGLAQLVLLNIVVSWDVCTALLIHLISRLV